MPTPRLTLAHSTLHVHDADRMLAFYCDVLGFHISDRGKPRGEQELIFLTQDPANHHQVVFVTHTPGREHAFVMADHLAFRTGSLDDLREIARRLEAAGTEGVIQLTHGNAWSLYFTDPEGNGVECFVDTPFHVSQPFGKPIQFSASDEEIEATTRALIQDQPGFQPVETWRTSLVEQLDAR